MTFSVVNEKPTEVFGLTQPQVSKRLGVFEERKYCKRTGYPFSNDDTNDREMLSSNTGVKITRSGFYAVSFCSDHTTTDAIKEHRLNVNGSVVRQVGFQPTGSRNYVPGNALLNLSAGDVLTLSVTGGSVNNTTATYIEVFEM